MKSVYILFILICLCGCGWYGGNQDDAHDEVMKSKIDYQVDAKQLLKEYKENELVAKKKYENKIIEVQGEVKNIVERLWMYPFIELNGFMDILCYFHDDEDVLKVKEGMEVRVKGKVVDVGDIDGTYVLSGCVVTATDVKSKFEQKIDKGLEKLEELSRGFNY